MQKLYALNMLIRKSYGRKKQQPLLLLRANYRLKPNGKL
jgi:hypothetical protein